MPSVLSMLRRVDWLLFLSVGVLAGLGVLAVWSVDLARDPGFLNFKKQLTFVSVGFVAACLLILIDYRAVRASARLFYVLGLALLIGVLIFGVSVRGTRGWFELGGWTFQPVEFAKIFLIAALAKYMARKAHVVDPKVILGTGLLVGLYVGATLAQPDFGSALVLLAIAVGMLAFTSVPRRYVVGGVLLAGVAAALLWNVALADYQKARIASFVNPAADPFGRGYNIRQAVIAVGSGGLFGRGLGEGSQAQLRFLPEAQTDFIFAVLAEELGFFVVALVIAAYALMLQRLVAIARAIKEGFALFFVAGVFVVISVQAILNIGMNLGLLPIVGLPLPFVSYGGSAMLANFLMLGIVQSIRVRG